MKNTFKRKFYCKGNDALLVVNNIVLENDNFKDDVIQLTILNETMSTIYLSIKDAELLMDAIHNSIIKAEGVSNV